MKFLVDAQLPRRLALRLSEAGHDAVHTLDLSNANRTSDSEINAISVAEQRVVITKDSDFVDSFLLQKKPWKLLLISTGNISNLELEKLFLANLTTITDGFLKHDYIEINQANLVFHR